jgi:hypothetical protein
VPRAIRTLTLALGAMLAFAPACGGHEPPRHAAGTTDPAHPGAPAPATTPGLDALDAALTGLEDSCEDSCCLAQVPPWITSGHGAPDTALLEACRRALSTPASPRTKALAALCASATIDLRDVPPIAALLSVEGDAGALPEVRISQAAQLCYPVSWSRRSLREVALRSLDRITGQRFASADDFHAWHRARGSLEGSFEYWEGALDNAPYDRRPALLASLRGRDILLYLRVVLMAVDGAVHGVDPAATAATLRDTLGVARLVRLLHREESFPEFTRKERYSLFVKRTAELADEVADPALAAGLLRLWEMEGDKRTDSAEGALALAASRLHPPESRRILGTTLRRLRSTWGPVLEEIARRHADDDAALLNDWFTRARADEEKEVRVAILTGLRTRGAASIAAVRAMILAPGFDSDNAAVIEALMDILSDADPRAVYPCRRQLWGIPGKGMLKEEAEARAKQAAQARRDCLAHAKTWLRAPR